MRGDHHGRGGHAAKIIFEPDTALLEIGEDGFIVDEVTEDSDRLGRILAQSQIDGITNAEAHS